MRGFLSFFCAIVALSTISGTPVAQTRTKYDEKLLKALLSTSSSSSSSSLSSSAAAASSSSSSSLSSNYSTDSSSRIRKTCCSSTTTESSSYDDRNDCQRIKEIHVLDRFNFRNHMPTYPEWQPYSINGWLADDGQLEASPTGGILNSKVFTKTAGKTSNIINDNFKYLLTNSVPAELPTRGSLYMQIAMGSKSFKVANSPYPTAVVQDNDYRLASSGFLAIDPTLNLVFGFLLTNDRIYGLYQRWRTDPSDPAADFMYVKPLREREPMELHHLAIIFDATTRTVLYRISDDTVMRITHVGMAFEAQYLVSDLGGTFTLMWPTSIVYGFGTLTFLNTYPACKTVPPLSTSDSSSSSSTSSSPSSGPSLAPPVLTSSPAWKTCGYPELRLALINNGDDAAPMQYNPILGPPVLAQFFDATSTASNRLWGQGTVVKLQFMMVYSITESCV